MPSSAGAAFATRPLAGPGCSASSTTPTWTSCGVGVVSFQSRPRCSRSRTRGDSADPERSGVARLTLERLEEALGRLSEEARWLFLLREGEGLSYAELADIFDVPVGTIRSRLARLRGRLLGEIAAGVGERRTKGAHDG